MLRTAKLAWLRNSLIMSTNCISVFEHENHHHRASIGKDTLQKLKLNKPDELIAYRINKII